MYNVKNKNAQPELQNWCCTVTPGDVSKTRRHEDASVARESLIPIQFRESCRGLLQPVLLREGHVLRFNRVECVRVPRLVASVRMREVHHLAVEEDAGPFANRHRPEITLLVTGRWFVVN